MLRKCPCKDNTNVRLYVSGGLHTVADKITCGIDRALRAHDIIVRILLLYMFGNPSTHTQDLATLWRLLEDTGEEADLRARIQTVFPFVDACTWAVGTRVEARYAGRNRWYSGHISKVCGVDSVDVRYDDGYLEHGVKLHLIRREESDAKTDEVSGPTIIKSAETSAIDTLQSEASTECGTNEQNDAAVGSDDAPGGVGLASMDVENLDSAQSRSEQSTPAKASESFVHRTSKALQNLLQRIHVEMSHHFGVEWLPLYKKDGPSPILRRWKTKLLADGDAVGLDKEK